MSKQITAEDLLARYGMSAHVENGSYLERHYLSCEPGRPASGSMYYYVSPGEITKFHSIDCDEYWCYVAGSPLEICIIEPDGEVKFLMLGTEQGCEPLVYLKKGVKFASRHPAAETEGTFLTCITVPRFCYEGFTMFDDGEIMRNYPETARFYELKK